MKHTRIALPILALGMLGAVIVVEARPSVKLPTIGYLGDTPGMFIDAFRRSIHDLGYIEGRNIIIDPRWTEGRYDRLPQLVADLVRSNVDVIVTAGTQTSQAAKHGTTTIPIVMAHVGNPVASGLVPSLSRPGRNITGVSVYGPELASKQLALLKEVVPTASRVGVLVNPVGPNGIGILKQIQAAAPALGVTVLAVEARTAQDLANALTSLRAQRADALFVVQDQTFFSDRARIIDFAAKNRLPAMYMYREWAHAGGLVTYGADLREVYRRVAVLVDKILKGAKAGDLPVEQATRLEFVINLKAAKALGLTIPSPLLVLADEVIQ
jgi:putative tryptophan/tyrosine transport system substrate-binding protein